MFKLYPHQQFFYNKMMTHKRYGIFLKQGGGKTLLVLKALNDLFETNRIKKVLILTPVSCIEEVWIKEIMHWGFKLTYQNLYKTKNIEDKQLYIASSDFVRTKQAAMLVKTIMPDTLIVDESSKYRNLSLRTVNLIKLIYGRRHNVSKSRFNRVYILSGTPKPNHLQNLWPQIFLLDGGKALGPTLTFFRQRYFYYDPYQVRYIPKESAENQVNDAIKSISATAIPPHSKELNYIVKTLLLNPSEYRFYQKFKKEYLAEIEGEEISAINVGALYAKLRQITGGACYNNDEILECSRTKLQAFLEFIELQQGEPVLVGYFYKHERERLLKALSNYTVEVISGQTSQKERQRIIEDWNNKKIEVLLGQPAAMGHGLNLQYGGSTILWYTLPNGGDFELYDQFNARLNRIGQTEEVCVHHLLIKDTVDETMYQNIQYKNLSHKELMEALHYK